MTALSQPADCLIVGGGPAGLTAAIYAARFRLRTVVVDAGPSRAALIPCTNNHAGFPDGVSGEDLLERMRAQALRFGAELRQGRVSAIEGRAGDFAVKTADLALHARAVILATGVTNHRPAVDEALHAELLAKGLLRYCPVCDGFEVTDRRVGVVGGSHRAAREAIFLRAYTHSVTLIAPDGIVGFDEQQQALLDSVGISVLAGRAADFRIEGDEVSVEVGGVRRSFESIYSALGTTPHSALAKGLFADLTDDGCIRVDAHQRTSVTGLYAAGDVVLGLDQISHAMGEAGVAATTLRNDLAATEPLLR